MGTEPEIIAARLKLGEWRTWAPEEQKAIANLFFMAWRLAANLHPYEADSTPWFRGMAILRFDMTRWLEMWRSSYHPNLILQFARFLESEAKPLSKPNASSGSHWADCDERTLLSIRRWLLGDAVEEWSLMACDHLPSEQAHHLDQALIAVEEARERLKAAP